MPNTLTPTPPLRYPAPLSIASVWLLVARWQMALFPLSDGTWSVMTPVACRLHVAFAAVPQAIQDVAQRCEATAEEVCYDEP